MQIIFTLEILIYRSVGNTNSRIMPGEGVGQYRAGGILEFSGRGDERINARLKVKLKLPG